MKQILVSIWNFLESIAERRYQQRKGYQSWY